MLNQPISKSLPGNAYPRASQGRLVIWWEKSSAALQTMMRGRRCFYFSIVKVNF
jgi:hypothetical protein